jgi:hypothetical protein
MCYSLGVQSCYWHTSGSSNVVSPDECFVSSILFLCHRVSCNCEVKSSNLCSIIRAVVFTTWWVHCPSAVALFGQLLLQQGRAISFKCCPLSHEVIFRFHHLPHFGRLACHPTPALTLCASPNLCWVLKAPLGGWLITPFPLSAFAALPAFLH